MKSAYFKQGLVFAVALSAISFSIRWLIERFGPTTLQGAPRQLSLLAQSVGLWLALAIGWPSATSARPGRWRLPEWMLSNLVIAVFVLAARIALGLY